MKRKLLALALSLAMVFTVMPAESLQAEQAGKEAPLAEQDAGTEELGENVARTAKADAAHTNVWGISTNAINDGVQATAADTSWNSWGADAALYPMPVTLTWQSDYTLSGMRVMWWADTVETDVEGGVAFPKSAEVEYLDEDGETWHSISAVGVEHGGAEGADGVWNAVTFPQKITTRSLRMKVQRSGTDTNGVGISEWEVFGSKVTDKLQGAVVTGDNGLAENGENEYTAAAVPSEMTESSTFEWSVSPAGVVQITGPATGTNVKVKAVKPGKAVLKLKVSNGGIIKEKEINIHVEGLEEIVAYETATAAGTAPILPDSVVAKGLVFDDPTPSLMTANNNVDLGETFDSKLIPVTWEKVDASSYSADKVGKTFEVQGKAEHDGKKYDAVAKITVKKPSAAAESNRSVTFENVQLNDNFWAPKQETNALASLDKAILEIGKASGGEPNFDNAIKKLNGEEYEAFKGFVFQDSDIYKSIEAISYTLSATQNDTGAEITAQRQKLEEKLNSWIEKIEKVQYADGYIDTFFTLRSTEYSGGESTGTHRWKNFSNHEMYNAGHFLESVVAYTRYREGIGKPDYRLYVAGKRFADEIVTLFGENGSRHEVPGHEEIELALVKFGKLAEEYEGEGAGQNYYNTAKIFIDRRGEAEYDEETGEVISNPRDSGYFGHTYSQDKTPFKDEVNAKGHSVRAGYFYAGITDVASTLDEGDKDRADYLKSLDRIWNSVTNKKTYITGGIGTTAPSSDSEGFGDDYVLPNDQSYCEICAAISMANWNQRMNLLYEDGKYADSVEKALYNAVLVGTNLDGNRFYYSTLLEAKTGNRRSEWFACACCPPNLMRTIAALSGYMYTVHNNDVFVNMYVGSKGNTTVSGTNVELVQETDYPWNGAVKLTVNPQQSKAFALNVRIPGWVEEQSNKNVVIKVNGTVVNAPVAKGYASVNRTWNKGDIVTVDIPMEVRKTEADPNVTTNEGRIALQRGPIVYCLEKAGNAQLNPEIEEFDPLKVVIPRNAKFKASYNKNLLKGVVELTGDVKYSLYGELLPVKVQAVPYYAWNNRGDDADYVPGEVDKSSSKMLIWTMADEAKAEAVAGAADDAAPDAKVSADKTYSGARIEGVHDTSFEPASSSMGDGLGWSNWTVPRDTTEHWLMYEWDKEITTKQMQIYWYDNYWNRIPGSLKVQYKDADGNWQDAVMKQKYEEVVEVDQYNTIDIDEITTKAIRLLMTVNLEQEGTQSIGVYRWKVMLDKDSVANNVVNMINKIGTVEATLASRKLIYDARMAYDSLAEELKAKVTNYDKLTKAETDYKNISTNAAKPVEDLIRKIGTVQATNVSKKLIEDARNAYNNLTLAQKAAVSNYNVLLEAEDQFIELGGADMIPEPTVIDIAGAKVDAIPAQVYKNKALTPSVKVICNGKTLVNGTDYTASYSNNKNIGTATVTLTGKGNYKGTITANFSIIVKKNASYTVGNYKYKITKADMKGKGTVTLTGIKNSSVKNKLKKISVNDTVTIGGKKFGITAIGNNAFSGCKNAASAVIGKKVTKIGSKVFYNCKKLKKINIKAVGLKSVGKNTLKNIHKSAVITVPKKKLKAYKKILKSKGQKKTVKIK